MRSSFVRPLGRCVAAFGLASTLQAAIAEPINFNIDASQVAVFNDRIGNSRFFAGANTDSIRIYASVLPSPDSDHYGIASGSQTLFSANGGSTLVSVTHDSFGGYVQQMDFAGMVSISGDTFGSYTTIFNLANPAIIDRLDALDAIPFQVTVSNPLAPNGPSISYPTTDYDKNALPAFIKDIRLTGGGLQPTIDWTLPEGGATPTNVRVQVRRIEAESADGTRITAAKLVHEVTLPLSQTSYTFDTPFSNAGFPGYPGGLEIGERYEVVVVLDRYDGPFLRGRARTFFEFTPLRDEAGEISVFLPSVGPDGVYRFDVKVIAGQTIAIDPLVAIGYDYETGAGDPNFASVLLPHVGDGLYDLYLFDQTLGWSFVEQLAAGEIYEFGPEGVNRFRILGIETSAGLDPGDVTAFITMLTFTEDGRFTGTMTPITAFVPVPGSIALMTLGLIGLAVCRQRRHFASGDKVVRLPLHAATDPG